MLERSNLKLQQIAKLSVPQALALKILYSAEFIQVKELKGI